MCLYLNKLFNSKFKKIRELSEEIAVRLTAKEMKIENFKKIIKLSFERGRYVLGWVLRNVQFVSLKEVLDSFELDKV